jgi:two-component system chemotaxis response regulator CheB
VQDPHESEFPFMPRAAINNGAARYVLKMADMPGCIRKLVAQPSSGNGFEKLIDPAGELADPVYSCPECGGGMYEVLEGKLIRFRCRVGHILSPGTMLEAETETVERALWAAIRSLEDQAAVLRRLGNLGNPNGMGPHYRERARDSEEHARVIRGILDRINT